MKRIFFEWIIISLFFCTSLRAQTTLIQGTVTDEVEQAVFAANVYLAGSPETGVTTGFEGDFKIAVSPAMETDTLIVSYLGYEKVERPVKTIMGESVLSIQLQPDQQVLQEVVVEAKNPIAEDFSVETLEKLDVYYNPFANGDALNAITALPASTNVNESANPSLRGSSPDRSIVALNGVPVYKPVRNSQINGIGNFSLFNTEIIDKQYIYPSNPPLTFGNTSAGLVEIQTIDALPQNNLQLSAGLANTGFFLSQRLNSEKSFLQLYGNRQFDGGFLALNDGSFDYLKSFQNTDIGLNLHHQMGEFWSLNLFSYAIDESYRAQQYMYTFEDISAAEKIRNFNVLNLNYVKDKWALSLDHGSNFSQTNFGFGNINSVMDNRQFYTALNAKYYPSESVSLQFGANHDYGYYRFNDTFPTYFYALNPEAPTVADQSSVDNHLLEYYAYAKWKGSSGLSLSAGLRKNQPLQDQEDYWSYQLTARYPINNANSIQLSAGQYHNYRRPNFLLKSFELLRARQVAFDYKYELKNTNINLAVYYKEEDGRVDRDIYTVNNVNTLGVEVSYQQQFARYFSAMVSNTFLDRNVLIEGNNYPARNALNYFFKASLSFNHPDLFNLSLAYLDRPGTFYTPVDRARFNEQAGTYEPIFSSQFNSLQLGSYRNLSMSLNRYFRLGETAIVGYLTINNLLNQNNPSGVFYNEDYTQEQFNYFQQRTIYFGVVWQLYY